MSTVKNNVCNAIQESIDFKKQLLTNDELLSSLEKVISKLESVFKQNGKILIAGNGGSAADAQHFAAEITCQYKEKRKGHSAIALHCDTSALTAWGNDISFETVFARLVEAHGKSGDALILISTSGNSKNLVSAAEKAHSMDISVFGLLGRDGGALRHLNLCNEYLIVSGQETPRIQECHILLIHIICDALDKFFVEFDNQK